MLSWKSVSLGIAAIIIVAFIFSGGIGTLGSFSNITSEAGEWFENSPFGGIFASPSLEKKMIDLTIYPETLSIEPDSSINISLDSVKLNNFNGIISTDFKKVLFTEPSSGLEIESEIEKIPLNGLVFGKLSFENSGFYIDPNITGDNGTIVIMDFEGSGIIEDGSLRLIGNVSKISVDTGELNWQAS